MEMSDLYVLQLTCIDKIFVKARELVLGIKAIV
jgi:hypothetical protein